MGFSCTIKRKGVDITKWEVGPIHCQLLDLGPSGPSDTDAPYRVSDFREVVMDAVYADDHPPAAMDAFTELQVMARENLESLKPEPHDCPDCKCHLNAPLKTPRGWSIEAIEALLNIPADEIDFMEGSQ